MLLLAAVVRLFLLAEGLGLAWDFAVEVVDRVGFGRLVGFPSSIVALPSLSFFVDVAEGVIRFCWYSPQKFS